MHGADKSTDRGAADDLRSNAGLGQRAQHADMCPAAGRTRAEGDADLEFAFHIFTNKIIYLKSHRSSTAEKRGHRRDLLRFAEHKSIIVPAAHFEKSSS